MNERDLMRFFEEFDGEVSMSDFSPEELMEALAGIDDNETVEELKRKYFAFYDDVKSPALKKQDW